MALRRVCQLEPDPSVPGHVTDEELIGVFKEVDGDNDMHVDMGEVIAWLQVRMMLLLLLVVLVQVLVLTFSLLLPQSVNAKEEEVTEDIRRPKARKTPSKSAKRLLVLTQPTEMLGLQKTIRSSVKNMGKVKTMMLMLLMLTLLFLLLLLLLLLISRADVSPAWARA